MTERQLREIAEAAVLEHMAENPIELDDFYDAFVKLIAKQCGRPMVVIASGVQGTDIERQQELLSRIFAETNNA